MGDSGGPSESQVGDDPATFDDEGVGYGNINTTTEQALRDDPTIDSDFSADDAAAARANIEKQLETQAQVDSLQQLQDQTRTAQRNQFQDTVNRAANQAIAERERQNLEDTTDSLTAADLNVIADLADQSRMQQGQIPSVPTTFTQGSIFDVDDFSKATDDRTITQRGDIQKQTLENLLSVTPNVKDMMKDQKDFSDFNITGKDVKSTADLRKRAKGILGDKTTAVLGLPGLAINFLTGLPAKSTLADLDKGMVPDFQNMKDGQIQGTTDKGFGADQTAGYIGGLSINAPGVPGGLNTPPVVNFTEPTETDDGGGDETVEQQMRKPKEPTDPCPEGYKLIDGKCTIIEDPNEGTGFIRFPTDRDPPFQKGPFQPKSTPTPIAGIRGLNPITFNNPFRT